MNEALVALIKEDQEKNGNFSERCLAAAKRLELPEMVVLFEIDVALYAGGNLPNVVDVRVLTCDGKSYTKAGLSSRIKTDAEIEQDVQRRATIVKRKSSHANQSN